MTAEQLDELERLAKSAPLGEWPEDELWDGTDGFCSQGPYHTCPHGQHKGSADIDACNEALSKAALADQKFLQKAAEYAVPMIQTIRTQTDKLTAVCLSGLQASTDRDRYKHERDEARAELTRLRNLILEAGVSEPVTANLPFYLIHAVSWNRLRAAVTEPFPTVVE